MHFDPIGFMPRHLTFVDAVAVAAVVMNIIGYSMKTMIPLRIVAMTTNCLFVVYSILAAVHPTLILNCILFPINAVRFFQMKRLIKQVNRAANSDLSMEWLKPYATRRRFAAGTVVFHKDDPANGLHLVIAGRFRVVGPDVDIEAGGIVGELGLLSPRKSRTATVECTEQGETLAISYDDVMQIYFQNPSFGFYFLQLSTMRLFHTIRLLEEENAALRKENRRLGAPAG